MSEDTFISHLVELRDRLLRALIAVGIVFVCLFPFASDLYDFLAQPLLNTLPEGAKMIATGVVTPFLIPVKVAAMVAFAVALPYVLYQAWAFIAPGLYAHEKRLVLPLVLASTVLFFLGVAFCYFFVFHLVFKFVFNIAPKSISVAPDIENYLNFVLTLFLAFGVTFEVPIVVLVLAHGDRDDRAARQHPAVLYRGGVRRCRDRHAARRGLPADACNTDVAVVRARVDGSAGIRPPPGAGQWRLPPAG